MFLEEINNVVVLDIFDETNCSTMQLADFCAGLEKIHMELLVTLINDFFIKEHEMSLDNLKIQMLSKRKMLIPYGGETMAGNIGIKFDFDAFTPQLLTKIRKYCSYIAG